MITYQKVERGDILKIVGAGAPGHANLGDLVRVIKTNVNGVLTETKDGNEIEFVFNCGAARLEETEWKKDFPAKEISSVRRKGSGRLTPKDVPTPQEADMI